MSTFENNLPVNVPPPVSKNVNKQSKEAQKPEKPSAPENPTLANAALNQSILNTNTAQANLNNQNVKDNLNIQVKPTPSQLEFHGPTDLPAYAGIANMSLKSWISNHDTKTSIDLESLEKQLTVTLEGIKGFEKENYEGFDEDTSHDNKANQWLQIINRKKNLIVLPYIFSCNENSGLQDIEMLVKIANFKKLGSLAFGGEPSSDENYNEAKLLPPIPDDPQKLTNLNASQIKYLHKLFALPNEFPEYLRLFAKDSIEINSGDLKSFLEQRVKLVQEQILGGDNILNTTIKSFVPLLNQNDYTPLLPLILLYYPLPLPHLKEIDALQRKKKKNKVKDNVIASCEIYFLSKSCGTFLIKFHLNDKKEFSFDIQTSETNKLIIRELEIAIAEAMILLAHPPLLSDLNVKLTEEIYKATDIDEELSIISSGPIRLEIVLAVYSTLVVLNKLSNEADPGGLIDITNLV